ncbi:MAG: hypothetical protein NTY14_06345 [Candidatus Omnitrophica bacterium]|nr:hypothetical protein [Candidatus Omnitrophota bacterium]
MRKSLVIFLLLLVFPGICPAKELSGKQAAGYVGSLKERLAKRSYGLILLERRNYDSANHADFDGLVFLPAGTKYRYIRKLDDDHRLKINIAQGRQAEPARPEDYDKYAKLIAENKLDPYVVLDKDNQELLIVYCTRRVKIFWNKESNNEIFLELRDPFKKDDQDFPLNNLNQKHFP